MSAGVQPAIQRIDLVRFSQAKIGGSGRVQIERAHAFEHEGVIGKNRRKQTCRGWLHSGLLHFDGQETGRKAGRAWKRAQDGSASVDFLSELDRQLFRADFAAFVEKSHIPALIIARGGNYGDCKSLQRARRQFDNHPALLTRTAGIRVYLDYSRKGGAIILDLADDRNPRAIRHNSVVAEKDVKLQGSARGKCESA